MKDDTDDIIRPHAPPPAAVRGPDLDRRPVTPAG